MARHPMAMDSPFRVNPPLHPPPVSPPPPPLPSESPGPRCPVKTSASFGLAAILNFALLMSSESFWSSACQHATSRTLEAKLQILYSSSGATVSRKGDVIAVLLRSCGGPAALVTVCFICVYLSELFAEQISAYCVSGLVGGTMFYLWQRMEAEERGRVWRLYGWFSGLIACGSCVGVVAWTARMMILENFFKAQNLQSQKDSTGELWSLVARGFSWRPSFSVAYAISVMCLSAAKLMVLRRMFDFVAPTGDGLRKHWAAAGRIIMAAAVLGNAVGLAANIAAAVHYQKAAVAAQSASDFTAANNSKSTESASVEHFTEVQLGSKIASVQSVCEVCVLLLIIVAFVAAGVFCARIFAARLLTVDTASAAASTGRALRLKIVGTTAVVFVAFLLRSVFATIYAVAYQLQDFDNRVDERCFGKFCDSSCYNVHTATVQWLINTPEFQLTIELISSPLALLVALWGMTSKASLRRMSTLLQRALLTRNTQ
jgi:hypothetical protein